MANELKITDVVDKSVFDQLGKLKSEFNENYAAYKKFIELLANGMKTSPKSLQDLSDKSNAYNKALSDLITTQNKLSSIQERQNKLLEDYGNKVSKLLTMHTLPKQFDNLTKTIDKLSGSLNELSSKFQTTSTAQNSASQANQSYTQSIQQTSQAVSLTSKQYADIINNVMAYDQHAGELNKKLTENKISLREIRNELETLSKEFKRGAMSRDTYIAKTDELTRREQELSAQNKQYSALLRNHAAVVVSSAGSYNEMSAAVLQLEKRFKDLSPALRSNDIGKGLLNQISGLKNELKSIDAQMGNYQRNVGNYSSSWNGLNVSVQQVARELPSLAVGWNTFFLAISNNLPMLADELKKANNEFKAMQASGQKGIPVWKQLTGSILSWQTALVVGITLLSVYGKDIAEWISNLVRGEKATKNLYLSQRDLNGVLSSGIKQSADEVTKLKSLYKIATDVTRSTQERNDAVKELKKSFPEHLNNLSNESIKNGEVSKAIQKQTSLIIANAKATAAADQIAQNWYKSFQAGVSKNIAYITRQRLEQELAAKEATVQQLSQTRARPESYVGLAREIEVLKERIKETDKEIQQQESLQDSYQKSSKALEKLVNVSGITGDKNGNKKASDEQAKYQEDIAKRLSDTRISLIDDEYEKERATAQKKYEENMASIKGYSEEENKLRANYEEILQNELLSIDKKYLDRIDEEEKNRREDTVKSKLEESQQVYATSAILASQNMQKEINYEAERYEKGVISKEQYEKEKAKITEKYAIQEAQRAIDLLKEQLEISGLSDEEKIKIKESLAKAEIDLINKVRDARVKAANDSNEAEKKYWNNLESSLRSLENVSNNAVDGLGALFGGLTNLITKVVKNGKLEIEDLLGSISAISEGLTAIMVGMYDRQIEKIEEEKEKNEEAKEEEFEHIDDLVNKGAISKEEAEARKQTAEMATADKNKELEKQKAELEQKQAKWQKANSIVQTTIATSLAIMQAFAQAGPIAGAVLAAVIGAMGAAQIAIIAAQPIPKYAKGTDNHPGGLAIVGDGGKQEVIATDDGAYITPSVPTLVDIPKRAKVIPNIIDYRKMALHSDALMLDRQRRSNNGDEPVIVNVNNDYTKLERKFDDLYGESRKTNRTLRKISKSSNLRSIVGRIN